jgi:hypothetical protein
MAAYSDGNAPFGSQVVTIGATAYVAENISYTEPSTVIERRDEDGDPKDQVVIAGFGNGSGVLQFATTVTVVPAIGATFTLTRNGGATAATIGAVVTETGETYTQLDAKKCNINFRRRYAG